MTALFATIGKELTLLIRDRAGLLVLFLMPAVLVIVVSLVQANILKATGETDVRLLLVDRDGGGLGAAIADGLADSGMTVERPSASRMPSDGEIPDALTDGDFQFSILIPDGTTAAMETRLGQRIARSLGEASPSAEADPEAAPIRLYVDPTLQGTFRSAVAAALTAMLRSAEKEMMASAMSDAVEATADRIISGITGSDEPVFPRIDPGWGRIDLATVELRQTGRGGFDELPSAVQQNVPAWALFGMFFIVVPLGGSIIRERDEGTLRRLMTLPVPYAVLLAGKVVAYLLVCFCQFGIILCIGRWLLPLLGTSALEIGTAYGAIVAVTAASALAAAGYGIMLGTLARTYEQASMIGAVSVVIAAALGGVMVPVYVMPEIMREISRFSPLGWGLDALTDLFVRSGDLSAVYPRIGYLLAFALTTLTVGWLGFSRRRP